MFKKREEILTTTEWNILVAMTFINAGLAILILVLLLWN